MMSPDRFPIGFIGPGIMGAPMVRNLLRAGFPVSVYGRRAEAVAPLVAAGAQQGDSPAACARGARAVLICVSDTPDVEEVVLGPNGVSHGAAPGTVVVDMSTISPIATRRLAVTLAEQGIEMLDAPLSGGEGGAIAATLSIMVGGKAAVFERMRPVFECLGKNIVHVGDHGAGQVAKMANQIVAAGTIAAVAEALALARANGVDAGKVRAALLGGFAYSKVLEVHGQRMLDGNYAPGFRTRLHRKDLAIVRDVARALGVDLPVAALSLAQLESLIERGDGDLDSSAIYKLFTAE
jgi:2-hydroxy-3-oxopropionate reductase